MKETGNISVHLLLLRLGKQLIYTCAEVAHTRTTWQTLFTTSKHHLRWAKHASVRQMVILFMSLNLIGIWSEFAGFFLNWSVHWKKTKSIWQQAQNHPSLWLGFNKKILPTTWQLHGLSDVRQGHSCSRCMDGAQPPHPTPPWPQPHYAKRSYHGRPRAAVPSPHPWRSWTRGFQAPGR